ncbi:MAG: acyltransferase family protein [Desulfuromonadaceae bacterium]
MKYMVQLDSLRAFAVLAVIFQHTWLGAYELGAKGGHLFFVLSGFLITGILLNYRKEVISGTSIRTLFAKFYYRRTLRIFPVYYITVILIALLGVKSARESFVWNLTYLANIKAVIDGSFSNSIAHFWSLCVEEQFYLAWPFMILCTSRKYLKTAIIVTAFVGPLSRLLLAIYYPHNSIAPYVLPFSCLDYLALGALLGYARSEGSADRFALWSLRIGVIAFPLFFVLSEIMRLPSYLTFMFGTVEALFYVGLIYQVSLGMTGMVQAIMENNFLLYLGKISYGIYLFHPFVAMLVTKMISLSGGTAGSGVVKFTLTTILTIVLAGLSWHLVEKPINMLKDTFNSKEKIGVSLPIME